MREDAVHEGDMTPKGPLVKAYLFEGDCHEFFLHETPAFGDIEVLVPEKMLQLWKETMLIAVEDVEAHKQSVQTDCHDRLALPGSDSDLPGRGTSGETQTERL
jgi:hypothetical protein